MSLAPQPPQGENWLLTKPSATGRRGVVVSQARPGAEAGIAILEAGGNAIDAAVGTAMALASQEPWNSGLGGYGGFAVVHRAGQPIAEVVDFGPVSPRNLTTANFRLTGRMSEQGFRWPEVEGDTNIHGPLAVAVPSAVAGCERLHTAWGRLPMAEVMAPAVALAKRGLLQDWVHHPQNRHRRARPAPLPRKRPHLPARRPAPGAPRRRQPRLHAAGQPRRHHGTPRPPPAGGTSTRARSPRPSCATRPASAA